MIHFYILCIKLIHCKWIGLGMSIYLFENNWIFTIYLPNIVDEWRRVSTQSGKVSMYYKDINEDHVKYKDINEDHAQTKDTF